MSEVIENDTTLLDPLYWTNGFIKSSSVINLNLKFHSNFRYLVFDPIDHLSTQSLNLFQSRFPNPIHLHLSRLCVISPPSSRRNVI